MAHGAIFSMVISSVVIAVVLFAVAVWAVSWFVPSWPWYAHVGAVIGAAIVAGCAFGAYFQFTGVE